QGEGVTGGNNRCTKNQGTMSETDVKAQEQKPTISVLALWSFRLTIVSFAILVVVTILIISPPLHRRLDWLYYLIPYLVVAFLCSCPTALVLGIISIYKIRKYKLKGIKLATGALAINTVILTGIIAITLLVVRPIIYRMVCGMNMDGLGIALQIYANDFDGKYPTCDKWCDLLIEHADVSPTQFACPTAKKGPGNYAINPNCEPNSPNDVVLVFETKEGWNQYGGPETLVGDRHWWKGSCVLFNDGRVIFIPTERLGDLRWRFEDSNSAGEGVSKR
ncbi:MAG: hypothetical protein JSW23_06045, partial [Planctomycetota bacterium]